MTQRGSISSDPKTGYLCKKVLVNGQTVTLYSLNGQTWLSSPEQLPEIMERLDCTRILLNDPKAEEQGGDEKSAKPAPVPAPALIKPSMPKYRMRGPKPRPILDQGGGAISGPPVESVPASALEVKLPTHPIQRDSEGGAELAQPKKLVAPVSKGARPAVRRATAAVTKSKRQEVVPKRSDKTVAAGKRPTKPQLKAAPVKVKRGVAAHKGVSKPKSQPGAKKKGR